MVKHQSTGVGGSTLLGIEERRASTVGGSSALDRWLTRRILAESGHPPLVIELWDGTRIEPEAPSFGTPDPVARVEIRDRRTLYGLLVNPDVAFGDAVSSDRIRIHGDLVTFLQTVYRSTDDAIARDSWKRRFKAWLNRPGRNTRARSQSNIHHHYDLGNDFYRLWLDEEMVYSCAYYPHEIATLEEAQRAKMDLVCRKLELRPGQRVVEAGSGWGSLAIHMARKYGAKVRAFNISHEQILYARERASAMGLEGQVEFVEDDYRTVEGEYDVFVSVGMFEHVGVDNYRTFGEVAARSLKPEGRGLIQSIGRNAPAPNDPWIERRIFPGSYPPSLAEMSTVFEPQEFSVLDVENLRLHYARTCRAWLERFEQASDRVTAMYDADFVRAWGSACKWHVWGTICVCPQKESPVQGRHAHCKGAQERGPVFSQATVATCARCPYAVHTERFEPAARAALADQENLDAGLSEGTLLQDFVSSNCEDLRRALQRGEGVPTKGE